METNRSISEIENDIAQYFGVRENIIVPNVSWGFFKTHEADMVVISKAGYLTEIEIKRSWSDFLADFKKNTNHYEGKVDKLYYCVPDCIYDKVLYHLTHDVDWHKYGFKREVGQIPCEKIPCGIITFKDNGCLEIRNVAREISYYFNMNHNDYKLYVEEMLAIARLGTMRYWKNVMK